MNIYLFTSASLIIILALAHSILGEIRIFSHIKNVHGFPEMKGIPLLFKTERPAQRTIRMVWHITTVLALVPAAILIHLAMLTHLNEMEVFIVQLIAGSMFLCFILSLVMTKGAHMAWIGFLAIAVFAVLGIW